MLQKFFIQVKNEYITNAGLLYVYILNKQLFKNEENKN